MTKTRVGIPRAVRENVLREFSHRCAVCGATEPQIDHIDENPANNDPLNLLPLCPNCHLRDKHNPTAQHSPDKLMLFRKYKDPAILDPRFHPLFERAQFLSIHEIKSSLEEFSARIGELLQFVCALQMGEFYERQLHALFGEPPPAFLLYMAGRAKGQAEVDRQVGEYVSRCRNSRSEVMRLLVELLRYQDWSLTGERPNLRNGTTT